MSDVISFFKLNAITGQSAMNVLLSLGIFFIFAIIWALKRYKVISKFRESKLPLFSLIPFFGKRFRKETVKEMGLIAKEGKIYHMKPTIEETKGSFMDFVMDLPIYCIEEGFVASQIRRLLESGGARFQQVILHDKSDMDDVYLYIQKEGSYFIHNKGVYLYPWKNVKTIQHWDIQDMRPLFDDDKDAHWNNPLMNSRVMYSLLNNEAMSKEPSELAKETKIIILGLLVIGIIAAFGVYQDYKFQHDLMELINANIELLKR